MKKQNFKIRPAQIVFPISDNSGTFIIVPRPVAFPLMNVKSICKETLTIGMLKDFSLLGYQIKSEPQRIHWLYPVTYEAYERLIETLHRDGNEKFETLFKERFIDCCLHATEDCMLSPENSDLVNDGRLYNK